MLLKQILKYFCYICGIVLGSLIILVIYLVWFQPPFYFPTPTGDCAVATREYHWINEKRKEIFADDPEHQSRELMVKFWYPLAEQKPIISSDPYRQAETRFYRRHRPLLWLGSLSRPMYAYAQQNADGSIVDTQLPVIIFSPGQGGTYDSNTAHCQELASHGYLVISISHPYDSYVVQFLDGRVINGLAWVAQREKSSFFDRRKQNDEDIEVRIADVLFVLNKLEEINDDESSPFYQHIDLQNIGVMGQSYGGSTAVQACRRDDRIKAGIDMDGSLFGVDSIRPIKKPFMFLLAGDSVDMFDQMPMDPDDWKRFHISSLAEEQMVRQRYVLGIEQLARLGIHDFYIFVLQDAGHLDFTDIALHKEATILGRFFAYCNMLGDFGVGTIPGDRAVEITNRYILHFFDKYLKQKPSELLNDNGHFDEIKVVWRSLYIPKPIDD
jgi:dienelactone hydrolase